MPILVVVLLSPPWATAWLAGRVASFEGMSWLAAAVVWMGTWREIIAVVIFLIAAATDGLDGYLARRRREVTTLGKLLDPIADKLLTVSAFIALVELRLAPAWMIVVIVGREFAVSGMRSIAATRGVVIDASIWGKWKTGAQIVSITLLILTHSLERWVGFSQIGTASLWVVMGLALLSMWHYFRGFIQQMDLTKE